MASRDDARLEELLAEALDHLVEEPGYDLDAFARSHPQLEAELRSRLARMRAAGWLPGEVEAGAGPTELRATDCEPAGFDDLLAALRRKPPLRQRFEIRCEIGRGGMGRVVEAYDRELQRPVALKFLDTPAREDLQREMVARFLEEARITARLTHQGIVPIHDLGMAEDGALYYTMRLIEGRRTLATVFERAREGSEGWTRIRALDAILRACESVAYAHQRGVIHRDLKPSNILVGQLGEVFVVDWGLSRVLEAIPRDELGGAAGSVRPDAQRSQIDPPNVTVQGRALGTPYYMPPEQARGVRDAVDTRSDVYAMGAILYEYLAGHPPYARKGVRISSHELLDEILTGPPAGIAQQAPDEPPELLAICAKAMQRRPDHRYPSIAELAGDLRAFVEGRVVGAYETGAWAEARKWVARNKPLAASLAAALLAVVIGSVAFAVMANEAAKAATRAEAETAKVLRLSDLDLLQELVDEADDLWPPHPDRIPALESWLRRAQALVGNLAGHRETLAEMRARARPWSDEDRARDRRSHPRADELVGKQAELDDLIVQLERGLRGEGRDAAERRAAELQPGVQLLAEEVASRRTWTFDTAEDQGQHDLLVELIEGSEGLQAGLLAEDAIYTEHGWSVPKRLRFARALEEGFADGGEYARRWSQMLPALGEAYPSLDPRPQMGLLPIGPDPASGLWEFAHLMTGVPAQRGADGGLILTEETGVVLVLLPGGRFWMGAQSDDPEGQNFDPDAQGDEGPVHEVELSAFFLSKYEMTQGQWLRMVGSNPSCYGRHDWDPEWLASGEDPSLLLPVEQVSWLDCTEWLPRAGLELPSEAQWEYGARGGTDTPWWTGAEKETLAGAANLLDRYALEHGDPRWTNREPWLDDGATMYAPVGRYAPNPFGLHDVVGNLWESCLDGYVAGSYGEHPRRDPVSPWADAVRRVNRGGGFNYVATLARSSDRYAPPPGLVDHNLGVRPARALDR